MISFSNINKQYGKQLIFVDASFQLNSGEKVGLVGPNGSGKTTLFRMVAGEEAPDEGEVSVPKKVTIGYFHQDVEEMAGRSVLDEAIAGSGRVGDLHYELEELHRAMELPGQSGDMDRILARFGDVQHEYEHLGGYPNRRNNRCRYRNRIPDPRRTNIPGHTRKGSCPERSRRRTRRRPESGPRRLPCKPRLP
jgi:ATPase subunit of ABC transporter with duplicated ATPase domains